MIYALALCTLLASALHIFIFYLETIAWVSPLSRKTFGLTEEEALQTKGMASNQGVYNLLLAIVAIVGIWFYVADVKNVGLALVLAGCGSMVGAALYLFFSSNKKQAAMKQMVLPLGAVVFALLLL